LLAAAPEPCTCIFTKVSMYQDMCDVHVHPAGLRSETAEMRLAWVRAWPLCMSIYPLEARSRVLCRWVRDACCRQHTRISSVCHRSTPQHMTYACHLVAKTIANTHVQWTVCFHMTKVHRAIVYAPRLRRETHEGPLNRGSLNKQTADIKHGRKDFAQATMTALSCASCGMFTMMRDT
jgi:hypothetical protein